ncbi:hypothetical protein O9992_01090 [Vibrio lentus]|nr:hypothetical protein [Vibrio lentus]
MSLIETLIARTLLIDCVHLATDFDNDIFSSKSLSPLLMVMDQQ